MRPDVVILVTGDAISLSRYQACAARDPRGSRVSRGKSGAYIEISREPQ